jgi:cytidine deaminase
MSARKQLPLKAKSSGRNPTRGPSRKRESTQRASTQAPSVQEVTEIAALLEQLVVEAKQVRKNAYAPYSRYKVGAALLSSSGALYTGCNVENVSYGGTICAERGAIMQMVAAGERELTLCVIASEGPNPAPPCGFCRQVLAEFASDLPIVMVGVTPGEQDTFVRSNLSELLPGQFTQAHLGQAQAKARKNPQK